MSEVEPPRYIGDHEAEDLAKAIDLGLGADLRGATSGSLGRVFSILWSIRMVRAAAAKLAEQAARELAGQDEPKPTRDPYDARNGFGRPYLGEPVPRLPELAFEVMADPSMQEAIAAIAAAAGITRPATVRFRDPDALSAGVESALLLWYLRRKLAADWQSEDAARACKLSPSCMAWANALSEAQARQWLNQPRLQRAMRAIRRAGDGIRKLFEDPLSTLGIALEDTHPAFFDLGLSEHWTPPRPQPKPEPTLTPGEQPGVGWGRK